MKGKPLASAIICLDKPRAGKCIYCNITYKAKVIVGQFVNDVGECPPTPMYACNHCIHIYPHYGDCKCKGVPPGGGGMSLMARIRTAILGADPPPVVAEKSKCPLCRRPLEPGTKHYGYGGLCMSTGTDWSYHP